MNSTIGRPRALTDRQVQIILAWHTRYLVWRALSMTLKTQRELAREFGVSQSTISHAVRSKGKYKMGSPSRRSSPP
jgi:transposase